MESKKIAVVDIETTGNSVKKGDRIIQIAIVLIENNQIVETWSSFVNPMQPVPVFITELTGITNQDVTTAPSFEQIAPEVLSKLEGAVFVAHNIHFDLPFLNGELHLAGFNSWSGLVLDTVELSRVLLPTVGSFKLTDLTADFELDHDRPHQADSDALATAQLFLSLVSKAFTMPLVTLERLAKESVYLKSDIQVLFNHLITAKKQKLEDLPGHLEVYRGIAIRKKVRPDRKTDQYGPLDAESFLKQLLPGYVKRDAQLKMIHHILHSFEQKKHAVIEAGTGIGKTHGLLIPAVIKAREGHKTVITTHTLHQQAQMQDNAIRDIQHLLDGSVRFAVLKGKSNYIHMMKYDQSLQEDDSQYDIVLTKMQILTWLTETETGDGDELNLTGGGLLFWNRISHNGWFLNREEDPWEKYDYFAWSVSLAKEADVIITNHSLLASDQLKDQKLLPDYHYLMIDEAHHLEEVSRKQWGVQLDFMKIKFAIGQLSPSSGDSIYTRLQAAARKAGVSIAKAEVEFDRLNEEADASFHQLGTWFKANVKRKPGVQKHMLALDPDVKESRDWLKIAYAFERFLAEMKNWRNTLETMLDQLRKNRSKLTDKHKADVEEAYAFLQEWHEMIEMIRNLFIRSSDHLVIWAEGDMRSIPGSLTMSAREIDISRKIKSAFFKDEIPAAAVSATITVNNSFQYFMHATGLTHSSADCLTLTSPFDYQKQVRLMVPGDLPDIKAVSPEEYVEWITSHLSVIAEATAGRMLVLFTSHEMLRNTYELIKESNLMEDFVLIAQGITAGSRAKLSKNFQKFDKAVLFGTSSFWEGLDIPGENLSCLIMVRLPFSPPDEPLIRTQWEIAKANNRNPFNEISLPKAVLRFRQGFGRLIRHEQDRGVFIVFDRRITTASYGRAFTDSIPAIKVEERNLDSIIDEIEHWL
ncbi:ATP-dependent DNA helicase DinG [Jeotgalibacillus sp. R-1-5s-1]|uniref:ATP-dependent DNA helicase DinG n=1 Tax=Jeotgalibacillus sp. R-1-5s-1 TaxID=2555897 RepID=UPI00141ACC6E|nr:ATP-dependent DNA helicase DinG [Jeotgalibacillus sp. R-1-5s-1]